MSKRIFESNVSFEAKGAKPKFNILNRKIMGTNTNVLKSRTKAISKRKQALHEAFEKSSKSNKFDDNRIGESAAEAGTMTEEDKYFKRYQLERVNQLKALKKKGKFSLQDEEELTHMGQTLSTLSENALKGHEDDNSSSSDDEKEGRLSAEVTRFANFGGGFLEGERNKILAERTPEERAKMTKREVMIDIMRKSKIYKAERQGQAAVQLQMAEDIDKEFKELKGLLEYREDSDDDSIEPHSNVGIDGKLLVKAQAIAEGEFATGANVGRDKYMFEANRMQESLRAKAGDRLRSDEEIAKYQREKLVKLEKARLHRMNPDAFSSASEDDDDMMLDEELGDPLIDLDDNISGSRSRVERTRQVRLARRRAEVLRKGDDDDEEELEEDGDDEEEEDGEEDEDDSEGDDEDEEVAAPSRSSTSYGAEDLGGNLDLDNDMMVNSDVDSDDLVSDNELPELSGGRAATTDAEARKKKKQMELDRIALAELDDTEENPVPFSFPAPMKYKAFRDLLDARGDDSAKAIADHELIVTRLRALYNIRLSDRENESRMEALYKHLYRHLRVVCEEESTRMAATEGKRKEKDVKACVSLPASDAAICKLDFVSRQLFELTDMLPRFSARVNRDFLQVMHTSLQERVAGITAAADVKMEHSSVFPLPHELMGMKLLGKLYPVTDFRHNITTPLMLVLAEILASFPVRGGRDVSVGLFIASMLLDYTSETRRFIPEIVGFLHASLISLLDTHKTPTLPADLPASQLSPRDQADFAHLLKPKYKTVLPLKAALAKKSQLTEASAGFLLTKRINKEFAAANAPGSTTKPVDGEVADSLVLDKLPASLFFLPHNNFAVFRSSSFITAALSTITRLTFTAAQTYAKFDSFPEIFSPIYASLLAALTKHGVVDGTTPQAFASLPATTPLAERFRALMHQLRNQAARACVTRKPLAKFARPMALREYTPEFKTDYIPGKNYDDKTERGEAKRKQEKAKRQNKANIRQVRRDNIIMMQEKQRLQQSQDNRRKQDRKRVRSELERDAGATNLMDNVSKKKRTI